MSGHQVLNSISSRLGRITERPQFHFSREGGCHGFNVMRNDLTTSHNGQAKDFGSTTSSIGWRQCFRHDTRTSRDVRARNL